MRMPASKDRHDVRKPSSMRHGFRSSDRKLRPTSTPWWQWRGVGSTTARSKISGVLTSDSGDNVSTRRCWRQYRTTLGWSAYLQAVIAIENARLVNELP